MIFYFSGTGNSKWIAERLSEYTDDALVDISTLNEVPAIDKEERLGFVFPIYAWGVADPMMTFIGKLPHTDAFTFGICTCGADAGLAMKRLNKVFPLDSSYSVVMPSNYIIGGDVESPEDIHKKLRDGQILVQRMAREIIENQRVYRVNQGGFAAIKTHVVSKAFNKFGRRTDAFYTTEACNGCGTCALKCPIGTIELSRERPIWGESCYQCLSCLNECPQEAIQYGKSTLGRGRYRLEDYL